MSIKGLLESATFQLLHRMLILFVPTSLKSYGHFLTLGLRFLSVTTMLKRDVMLSGKRNMAISFSKGVGTSTATTQ